MEKQIVIKYKTKTNFCTCCGQEVQNAKESHEKEFTLTKESFLEWTDDWDEVVKYKEDLDGMVEEFVYETISFFATSSFTNILIDQTEFDKAKKFVIEEFTV
jgi:hypothetical protein